MKNIRIQKHAAALTALFFILSIFSPLLITTDTAAEGEVIIEGKVDTDGKGTLGVKIDVFKLIGTVWGWFSGSDDDDDSDGCDDDSDGCNDDDDDDSDGCNDDDDDDSDGCDDDDDDDSDGCNSCDCDSEDCNHDDCDCD